jgi:hypothetical protein
MYAKPAGRIGCGVGRKVHIMYIYAYAQAEIPVNSIMNYPEAIFLFFSFTLLSHTIIIIIIIICGFPSGTRRLQSGHVYNETVNFMEDNLHPPLNP